jgi:cyclic pyranopterin phosphate synthase
MTLGRGFLGRRVAEDTHRPGFTWRRGVPDMPTTGPLVDRWGRARDHLRLVVTDHHGPGALDARESTVAAVRRPADLLSLFELARVAAVAHQLGVRSVTLTGGEPLERRGIERLVAKLRDAGFVDIALTTSGYLLAARAGQLAAAGLDRVTVRCNSLRPHRFAGASRCGDLGTVLRAMDVAESVGLLPLIVHVVLAPGHNDDEILDFTRFARTTGRTVRFIELTDRGRFGPSSSVPRTLERIQASFGLVPSDGPTAGWGRTYAFADGSPGAVAVAAAPGGLWGCGDGRLEVTADGTVRHGPRLGEGSTLVPALRHGTDAEVALVMRRVAWASGDAGL